MDQLTGPEVQVVLNLKEGIYLFLFVTVTSVFKWREIDIVYIKLFLSS